MLQDAFRTDVRPLMAEARGATAAPSSRLAPTGTLGYRRSMIEERGLASVATGL